MTLRAACPDWRTLAASRDQRDQPDQRDLDSERFGPDWSSAIEHLAGGCRACRDAAYAADPTLVFRRAPTFEPPADEIADLAASVRAMIRAGRIEGVPASDFDALTRTEPLAEDAPATVVVPSQKPVLRWRLVSLAAALVALLIGTAPAPVGHQDHALPSVEASAPAAAYGSELVVTRLAAGDAGGDPVEIETLDRPSANVYQFDDPGMDVVLIVDAGLDV